MSKELPIDDNRNPIEVGRAFQTVDISTSPKTSPYSLTSGGGIKELKTPANAVSLSIIATSPIKVSELSTMARYITLPANTGLGLSVAGLESVYIEDTTANSTVNFLYTTL